MFLNRNTLCVSIYVSVDLYFKQSRLFWCYVKTVVLSGTRDSFDWAQTHIFIEFKRDYKKHQLSLPYAAADPGSVSRSATTNKGEARGIASTD